MTDAHPGIDWQQDRFLVTGGAGFLGSHLCELMQRRGVARDRILVPRKEQCDLTNQLAVERLFADTKPTVVLHLAAEVGGIGANRANPGRYFYANMAMGLHLIEQARQHNLKKFVQVGTICAYPKFTPVPFSEDKLWEGYPEETNAPYGVAKKSLLVMCQAYREQYGLNAIYLLPVNLFGPRDNCDLETSHVIPAVIRKCIEAKQRGDERIVCWGDGSPTREFLYVNDAAEAILLATERYNSPEPVNLGSGREISVRELTETIANMVGYSGRIDWDTSRPNGQPRRCLDITRARERFGFVAQTSLEDGLRQTIDWYVASRKK